MRKIDSVFGIKKRSSMSIIENTKEIAELVKKLGNIDLYRRIVELEGEIIELSRQRLQLEQRVDELEKSARLKAEMVFHEPLYFQEGDSTPFCPTCFEKEGRAIHLINYGELDTEKGPEVRWYCKLCKEDFYISGLSSSAGAHGPMLECGRAERDAPSQQAQRCAAR